MRVWVETYAGHGGVEMPRRFRLDAREIEVVDNLDQWHGAHDRYFRVKGDDGNLYILRLDEIRTEWELIMFQSAQSQAAPADFQASKEPGGGVRM
jgi:hypothetical protein